MPSYPFVQIFSPKSRAKPSCSLTCDVWFTVAVPLLCCWHVAAPLCCSLRCYAVCWLISADAESQRFLIIPTPPNGLAVTQGFRLSGPGTKIPIPNAGTPRVTTQKVEVKVTVTSPRQFKAYKRWDGPKRWDGRL